MRRAAWITLVLLAYLLLEGLSAGALVVLAKTRGRPPIISVRALPDHHRRALEALLAGKTAYLIHSRALGWTIAPYGAAPPYRANSKGLRGDREYSVLPGPDTLRIAAFGDSFTHADDVKNGETWEAVLEAAVPRLEVMNFGVPGYGLDQAYLRYEREGVRTRPQIVLIGFMPENVFRSVNVYRPFYTLDTGISLAKPRYVLEGDRLVLIENPLPSLSAYRELLDHPERVLPRLGEHDYFFRTRPKEGRFDILPSVRLFRRATLGVFNPGLKVVAFDPDAEPLRVTVAVIDQFVGAAERNGSVPIVVVFPRREDVLRHRRGGTRRYTPLLEHLQRRQHRYIDLLDPFGSDARDEPIDNLVLAHYAPGGNRHAARAIQRYLEQHGFLTPRARTGQ